MKLGGFYNFISPLLPWLQGVCCHLAAPLVRGQMAHYGDAPELREHCPRGAHIQIRLRRRGRLACLAVQDDGEGIPQDQLGKVFDRFWRASPHPSPGGTGLGLAIAARSPTFTAPA